MINAALDNFAIPGDVSFPLNQAFEPPRDRQDAESLRAYVFMLRQSSFKLNIILMGHLSDISLRLGRKLQHDYTLGYTPAGWVPLRYVQYLLIVCEDQMLKICIVLAQFCEEKVHGKDSVDRRCNCIFFHETQGMNQPLIRRRSHRATSGPIML